MRLLLAEDDAALRGVLVRGLTENGYVVDAVGDGEAALSYLATYEYEVVVLDWRMPKVSGYDALTAMRARRIAVPVLMLTALDRPADRIAGLDHGADDYLVKPFDFGELLARLRALQRRPVAMQATVLQCGDVRLDPASRQAFVEDRVLAITVTELAILELLMRRSPSVVTRQSIAMNVWPVEADGIGSNTIDVHVARLRGKLVGSHTRIETMRGVGYRLLPS
ncbi:MAG TPA: response regulator transcription factor [Acidothermaceae bacterium]|nr:response regulator transcription factor [Acidothermaceae bacterium]